MLKYGRILLFVAFFIGFALASAGEPKIEITSFYQAGGDHNKMAELCGKVTGINAPLTWMKVVVDDRSNRPGTYYTAAGGDGKFCVAVMTFYGTVSVSIKDSNVAPVVAVAQAIQ